MLHFNYGEDYYTMDQMLKITNYRLSQISHFTGSCTECAAPLFCPDSIPVVVLRELSDRFVVAPTNLYACPRCKAVISTIDVYKEDSVLA